MTGVENLPEGDFKKHILDRGASTEGGIREEKILERTRGHELLPGK